MEKSACGRYSDCSVAIVENQGRVHSHSGVYAALRSDMYASGRLDADRVAQHNSCDLLKAVGSFNIRDIIETCSILSW
jgi:hypothetical protein